MIVDCHTHVWQSPDQLGPVDLGESPRTARSRPAARPAPSANGKTLYRPVPAADPDEHYAQAAGPVDKAFVLGFKSGYLRAEIPNRFLAKYVARDPDKLIGFAGIDPAAASLEDDLAEALDDLHLRGITLSPPNQNFHPLDTAALRVYDRAEKAGVPIVFHPGGQYTEQSKLEYGRPYLLDEVARSFPKLRFVIASMGAPWVDETICLLGKHPNVFADVSCLLSRPWAAYNALVNAHQSGAIDKLLFGSDFPYVRAGECIESLYSLNQTAQGTNLPLVPREALRGIIERDTLSLLGLE